MYEKVFDQNEHLDIFSPMGIRQLAHRTGFTVVAEEQWRGAHEAAVLRTRGDVLA